MVLRLLPGKKQTIYYHSINTERAKRASKKTTTKKQKKQKQNNILCLSLQKVGLIDKFYKSLSNQYFLPFPDIVYGFNR